MAVESVLDYVTYSMPCFYTRDPHHEDDFLEALHEAVMLSHEIVRKKADSDAAEDRMATTLTLLMGVWPNAYVPIFFAGHRVPPQTVTRRSDLTTSLRRWPRRRSARYDRKIKTSS